MGCDCNIYLLFLVQSTPENELMTTSGYTSCGWRLPASLFWEELNIFVNVQNLPLEKFGFFHIFFSKGFLWFSHAEYQYTTFPAIMDILKYNNSCTKDD